MACIHTTAIWYVNVDCVDEDGNIFVEMGILHVLWAQNGDGNNPQDRVGREKFMRVGNGIGTIVIM